MKKKIRNRNKFCSSISQMVILSLYLWTFCEQENIVKLHHCCATSSKNISSSLYFSAIISRGMIYRSLYSLSEGGSFMFSKDTFDSFASLNNIMKLLKRDPAFNNHCQQEKIKKGAVVELYESYNTYFYIIQSGCMKYNHDLNSVNDFQFLISKGDMPLLRPYMEELPNRPVCEALVDTIWWKIDYPFFKRCILKEDQKNIILLHHIERTRKKLYTNYLKNLLSSRQRVLFSLVMFLDQKIVKEPNTIEFPEYLNYTILAEFSATSKNYTSDILRDLRAQNILISTKKPWIITDLKKFRELLTKEEVPYL